MFGCKKTDGPSAAINATTTKETTKGSTVEVKKPEPLGKYSPEINITAGGRQFEEQVFAEGDTYDNNIWTRTFKEELGINLKYAWIAANLQYGDKVNVIIASGDIPDILQVNATQFARLLDSDLIEIDLMGYIDDYALPMVKDFYTSQGEDSYTAAMSGGKLAAFPSMYTASDTAQFMWIRTDWLEKLNLSEPRTMDELLTVMDAFVNDDPDGNGEKDTYAMAIYKDYTGGFNSIEGFLAGYHAYLNLWIRDGSGKIVYSSFQPEMKPALAKLAEMYKDGWLDREYGVKDPNKAAELLAANKVGIQFGAMWNSIYPLIDSYNIIPGADWKALPLVSADDKPALSGLPSPITDYIVIRKGYKNPEVVIKMLNLFSEKVYGENGDYKKYSQDPDSGMAHYKLTPWTAMFAPAFKNLTAYRKIRDGIDPATMNPEEKTLYDDVIAFEGGNREKWAMTRVFGKGSSYEVMDYYVNNDLFYFTQYMGIDTPAQLDKMPLLEKLVSDMLTKIIMGKDSVDSFDDYVKQAKEIGLDEVEKEVNEAASK